MRWHCCAAFGSRARKLIWRRAFMALGSAIGSVRHADGKALSEAPVEDLLCCIRCRASHCCVALIWSRVKPEKFAKLVQREVLWAQIEGVAKGNVIELCCAVKETFELAAQMGLDQRKRFRYGRRRARAVRFRGGDANGMNGLVLGVPGAKYHKCAARYRLECIAPGGLICMELNKLFAIRKSVHPKRIELSQHNVSVGRHGERRTRLRGPSWGTGCGHAEVCRRWHVDRCGLSCYGRKHFVAGL